MPSSTDRKRLEVPTYLYDRLVEIAVEEDRTVSGVVQEIIMAGLSGYQARGLTESGLERYTERAREALNYARAETVRFNHNYLGTEHILLGLLCDGDGVAARVLNGLGVSLEKVRERVEYVIGRGKGSVPTLENVPFAPRARKVLRLAEAEVEALHHHYFGTEHLLLALVRVEDGMAARILDSLGALNKIRPAVLDILTIRNLTPSPNASENAAEITPLSNDA